MSVQVVSNDGVGFDIPKDLALQCQTLKDILSCELASGSEIDLPNINSKTIENLIKYHEVASSKISVKNFFKMSDEELYHLTNAANYLNYEKLIDDCCTIYAKQAEGKTASEIRKMWNITNDLTPEEEEEIRRENAFILDLD
jgi:S-phase kinase-associated protein 1